MDRRALRGRLRAKFDEAMDRSMDAVEAAPDGQWIAGSEWAVRGAFQDLMRECFQEILQAKVDADSDPAAAAGSFPPGAPPAAGGAVQGRASRRRAERRR